VERKLHNDSGLAPFLFMAKQAGSRQQAPAGVRVLQTEGTCLYKPCLYKPTFFNLQDIQTVQEHTMFRSLGSLASTAGGDELEAAVIQALGTAIQGARRPKVSEAKHAASKSCTPQSNNEHLPNHDLWNVDDEGMFQRDSQGRNPEMAAHEGDSGTAGNHTPAETSENVPGAHQSRVSPIDAKFCSAGTKAAR
jgi:hypothetical protein